MHLRRKFEALLLDVNLKNEKVVQLELEHDILLRDRLLLSKEGGITEWEGKITKRDETIGRLEHVISLRDEHLLSMETKKISGLEYKNTQEEGDKDLKDNDIARIGKCQSSRPVSQGRSQH